MLYIGERYQRFIEGTRLNFVLVSTKSIGTSVKYNCNALLQDIGSNSQYLHWESPNNSSYSRRETSTNIEFLIICISDKRKHVLKYIQYDIKEKYLVSLHDKNLRDSSLH